MKKGLLIVLVILATNIASAQQHPNKANHDRAALHRLNTIPNQKYVIKANITGFKNGTKFYLNDVDHDINIDSAIINNDVFVFTGWLPEAPQNLWVTTTAGQKFYYFTLLIGNEHIEVKGDVKDLPFNLSVKGSEIQDVDSKFNQLIKDGYKRRNELMTQIIALRGDSSAKLKTDSLRNAVDIVDNNNNAIQKTFVKTHLNSYSGLNVLFYLKDEFPKDTLQQMYNQLSPLYKQSRFGKRINTYLKVGKILQEGDAAVDFSAIDVNNQTHRLSDIKNKYVLLDFSATYCSPCVASIDDLKKIATKYAANLSVITYSADAGKATWLAGVNRDKPTWPSLWDGKGVYGETNMKYGASGFPTFVLIDPQGKIAFMQTGFDGKGSLEAKVDSFIAKK